MGDAEPVALCDRIFIGVCLTVGTLIFIAATLYLGYQIGELINV
jgi:hypothetical protein